MKQSGRFWKKVRKTEGCWIWEGTVLPKSGYGSFHETDKRRLAHRLSYQHFNGPILDGKHIHHTCNNRLCMNPEHMALCDLATHPGAAPEINRNKTHCPKGHEYTKENTYIVPSTGSRMCQTCIRERRIWQALLAIPTQGMR